MRRILIIAIVLFSMPSLISAYNDAGLFRDGFKLNPNGNDINLMNRSVWNGSFNGSYTGWISNFTNDAGYVTNSTMASDSTKVNKSGDTMTGSLKQNRMNGTSFIGGTSFIDLTSLGLYGRTNVQFSLNRFFNETSLLVENGTYSNNSGAGFALDTMNTPSYPIFSLFYYLPNSTAFTYWFRSDRNQTILLNGNLTISNQSGTGNAYICVDASGKLFRGTPTC